MVENLERAYVCCKNIKNSNSKKRARFSLTASMLSYSDVTQKIKSLSPNSVARMLSKLFR